MGKRTHIELEPTEVDLVLQGLEALRPTVSVGESDVIVNLVDYIEAERGSR